MGLLHDQADRLSLDRIRRGVAHRARAEPKLDEAAVARVGEGVAPSRAGNAILATFPLRVNVSAMPSYVVSHRGSRDGLAVATCFPTRVATGHHGRHVFTKQACVDGIVGATSFLTAATK